MSLEFHVKAVPEIGGLELEVLDDLNRWNAGAKRCGRSIFKIAQLLSDELEAAWFTCVDEAVRAFNKYGLNNKRIEILREPSTVIPRLPIGHGLSLAYHEDVKKSKVKRNASQQV